MGSVRLCSARDHAVLEDAVHAPFVGAVVKPLGDLIERQDRDPFDAAHPLGLGVIEEAVESRGEEEIGVCIPHKLLAVLLRNADTDWEEGREAVQWTRASGYRCPEKADSPLLVSLGGPQKLSYAPSPMQSTTD